ncbi:MAG: 30S ribosomal protein S20 [Candidatus Marinimicrobia bacterium]|nr:30S ribosomal protein S20 [Candidatus Neomarinimicrobiota bacterium]|tara:strand:+ start:1746 stop:2000 length:255 start_codon:yes stop_codon:yes gene_type:complete
MSAKGTVLKRVRQSRKANSRNRHYKSMMKTAIKNILETTDKKDSDEKLRNAISIIDKVKSKGVIHKNTASRQKSRITQYINSLK